MASSSLDMNVVEIDVGLWAALYVLQSFMVQSSNGFCTARARRSLHGGCRRPPSRCAARPHRQCRSGVAVPHNKLRRDRSFSALQINAEVHGRIAWAFSRSGERRRCAMGGRQPAGRARTGAGGRAEAVSARGRGLHGVAASHRWRRAARAQSSIPSTHGGATCHHACLAASASMGARGPGARAGRQPWKFTRTNADDV